MKIKFLEDIFIPRDLRQESATSNIYTHYDKSIDCLMMM